MPEEPEEDLPPAEKRRVPSAAHRATRCGTDTPILAARAPLRRAADIILKTVARSTPVQRTVAPADRRVHVCLGSGGSRGAGVTALWREADTAPHAGGSAAL